MWDGVLQVAILHANGLFVWTLLWKIGGKLLVRYLCFLLFGIREYFGSGVLYSSAFLDMYLGADVLTFPPPFFV